MESEILPTAALIKDSMTHLLTVSFGNSSSPSNPLAINVAKGACKYKEIKIGGDIAHLVAFKKMGGCCADYVSASLSIGLENNTDLWRRKTTPNVLSCDQYPSMLPGGDRL